MCVCVCVCTFLSVCVCGSPTQHGDCVWVSASLHTTYCTYLSVHTSPCPNLEWYVAVHSHRQQVSDLHSGHFHILDASVDGDLVALLPHVAHTIGVRKVNVAASLFRHCGGERERKKVGGRQREEGR